MSNQIIGLLFFIIFFAATLFLAYVSTKLLGSKISKGMRGKHLKVIDSIGLGFDKQIHLIKVGEQLLLVSSSNKSLKFMTLLDNNIVKLTKEELELVDQAQETSIDNVFKNYLEMFKHMSKKADKTVIEEVSKDDESRFNNNLSKLKGIFSKIKSDKNGDEKPNE